MIMVILAAEESWCLDLRSMLRSDGNCSKSRSGNLMTFVINLLDVWVDLKFAQIRLVLLCCCFIRLNFLCRVTHAGHGLLNLCVQMGSVQLGNHLIPQNSKGVPKPGEILQASDTAEWSNSELQHSASLKLIHTHAHECSWTWLWIVHISSSLCYFPLLHYLRIHASQVFWSASWWMQCVYIDAWKGHVKSQACKHACGSSPCLEIHSPTPDWRWCIVILGLLPLPWRRAWGVCDCICRRWNHPDRRQPYIRDPGGLDVRRLIRTKERCRAIELVINTNRSLTISASHEWAERVAINRSLLISSNRPHLWWIRWHWASTPHVEPPFRSEEYNGSGYEILCDMCTTVSHPDRGCLCTGEVIDGSLGLKYPLHVLMRVVQNIKKYKSAFNFGGRPLNVQICHTSDQVLVRCSLEVHLIEFAGTQASAREPAWP